MLDLIQQMMPEAIAVEERHGMGRVRHLLLTTGDGRTRPCVLRRAPRRELELFRTILTPEATGAPALLGACEAEDEVWLLQEELPQSFPAYDEADDVAACYRHLAAMHNRFLGRVGPAAGPWALQAKGPRTLVHGDYHRWNLVLEADRVRVLDWEHASFAPPIWDLVLLAPEEPGWDGVPRGALARHALRIYHKAGPYARLAFTDFLHLQRRARHYVAARWARVHQAKAAQLPPGAVRSQIEAYAQAEADRARRLEAMLGSAENP